MTLTLHSLHPLAGQGALRRAALATLAALALALGGCSAMWAQNPDSPLKPVKAVAMDGDAHVMLTGHDVVAYFTLGRHALGRPDIKSVYQGVTFRFANAEHKALFDAAPTKYMPQYGGYCTNGIEYAIPWGGDADSWRIYDGKLYIFGGTASRDAFELDIATGLQRADRYWAEEVAGTNSFWQRTKRLIFRVPHYKTGAELAQAVALDKARKAGAAGARTAPPSSP